MKSGAGDARLWVKTWEDVDAPVCRREPWVPDVNMDEALLLEESMDIIWVCKFVWALACRLVWRLPSAIPPPGPGPGPPDTCWFMRAARDQALVSPTERRFHHHLHDRQLLL